MTVRDLKKLVRAIPREYNDFDIFSKDGEVVGIGTSPILSEHYNEAFNIELVVKNVRKETPKQPRVAKTKEE